MRHFSYLVVFLRLRQIASTFGTTELPIWFVVIAAEFAAIAALERALTPSVRWFFRRWMVRVIAKVSACLDRPIEPLKLVKQIDILCELMYYLNLVRVVNNHAHQEGVPENVAFHGTMKYDREIMSSFSA
tara:strand:+ start:4397 stop:4786 length:390 start_codon:yes stop_codon:yes gene_type:complete